MREALAIARFDHAAIRRTAEDPRALLYGAVCVSATTAATALAQRQTVSAQFDDLSGVAQGIAFALTVGFLVIVQLCVSALRIALVHGAAKVFFGATGRYVQLLRVVWLGSIVQILGVVPIFGGLIAGVWSLIIALVTFEEVDGIERLQALVLVLVVGVLSLFVLAFFSLAM